MVFFITYLVLHSLCFVLGSHATVEPPQKVIKNILRNNGESLKQLANKFPDHIIEMQVEMVGPTEPPKQSLSSIRRFMKFNKKPSIHLNKSKLEMLLRNLPMKLSRNKARSGDKNETDVTNLSTSATTREQITDPDNRPVYMKDLKEAVAALEKKLDSKTAEENSDGNHPLLKKDLWEILDIASQHHNAPSNRVKKLMGDLQSPQQDEGANESVFSNPSDAKNIGDVLTLIKKGVKVQFDIEQPTDPNLDWIKIKVPNNN